MTKLVHIGLLVALVLAVSGCGATETNGSVPAGAEFAPASVPVYIFAATDPDGEQWQAAESLLNKFPGREKLFASAQKDLSKDGLDWKRDVEPALPPDVHIVWLDFANDGNNVVGYAKPEDEVKFDKLLEAGDDPLVHRKIEGWTVFSDTDAKLDHFERARSSGDSLSDEDSFRDSMEKLPDDAAARGWVSGDAIQRVIDKEAAQSPDARSFRNFSKSFGTLESASFSAKAEDDGVKVEAAYELDKSQEIGNFSAQLDEELPSGALLYFSFGDLEDFFDQLVETADENFPEFKSQRSEFEEALGFSLKEDLFPLFSKEGAIAVYHGDGEFAMPNVLFVLRVPDEDKAQHVIDRLAALASLSDAGESRKVTIEGVQATEVILVDADVSIFAAVSDGNAYVTNSKMELESALGDAEKLADDAVYTEALDAAGAPDEAMGFIYLNLSAGLPYVFDFADAEGSDPVPPDVRANTKPLQSALLYAKRDGKRTSVSGFLTIK